MATLKTRLILRNDITDNWNSVTDLKLMKGEVGVEWWSGTGDLDGNQKQEGIETAAKAKLKIGDGFTTWDKLPYIQDSLINIIVGETGDGNTIVGATTNYDNTTGVYNLTLERGNRLADIAVDDDNVVNLEIDRSAGVKEGEQAPAWVAVPKIKASHVVAYPGKPEDSQDPGGYNGDQITKQTIDPKTTGSFNIEKSTVDKYGHTTNVTPVAITIQGHNIAIGDNTNTANPQENTVNVLTGLTVAGEGANGHTINTQSVTVYTKKQIDNLINPGMEFKGVTNIQNVNGQLTLSKVFKPVQPGDSYKIGIIDKELTPTIDGITIKSGDVIIFKPDNKTPDFTTPETEDSLLFEESDWSLIPSGDDVEDTWRPITIKRADETESVLSFTDVVNSNNSLVIEAGTGLAIEKKGNNGVAFSVQGDLTDTLYKGDNTYIEVTANPDTQAKEKYIISHRTKDKLPSDAIGSGTFTPTSPSTDKTVIMPQITVDEAGHVSKLDSISLTLPDSAYQLAFGKITVGSTITAADIPGDTLTVVGEDNWIIPGVSTEGKVNKLTFKHGGQSAEVTNGDPIQLSWITAPGDKDPKPINSFNIEEITSDGKGHITKKNTINITIPTEIATNKGPGLAPLTSPNKFLTVINEGTQATWQSIITLDGGNASTQQAEWGTITA